MFLAFSIDGILSPFGGFNPVPVPVSFISDPYEQNLLFWADVTHKELPKIDKRIQICVNRSLFSSTAGVCEHATVKPIN